MNEITSPLRLAVGSHQAGSGKGCAMNVISWENGDTEISDLPACADPFLAHVVQNVNDAICTHRDGVLLCAPCSIRVLALAHRTVGTALTGWPAKARAALYATIAREEADRLQHLNNAAAYAATAAANAATANAATAAYAATAYATAAYAATAYAATAYAAAAYAATAADAAAYAATAAANAYAATAAATAYAATAYAATAYAATAYAAGDIRLTRAHHIIDRFEALTGITAKPVPTEVTTVAVAAMAAH